MTFSRRLRKFLQQEFDAHVDKLLGTSKKPRCVPFNLTLVHLLTLKRFENQAVVSMLRLQRP